MIGHENLVKEWKANCEAIRVWVKLPKERLTSDSALNGTANSSHHYFVLEGSEDYQAELDCSRSKPSESAYG
jgi:hypothetical protein